MLSGLWHFIAATLAAPLQEGHALQSDALAGTSPFIRNHIVRLGQYSLDLNRQPPAIQYQLPIIPPAEQPDSSS